MVAVAVVEVEVEVEVVVVVVVAVVVVVVVVGSQARIRDLCQLCPYPELPESLILLGGFPQTKSMKSIASLTHVSIRC